MGILIGIGIGLAIAGIIIFFAKGMFWHTYHGDIVETVIKVAAFLVVVGALVGLGAYLIPVFL